MSAEWSRVDGLGHDFYTGKPNPPYVSVDPDDFAHGVWTALAATLAEPLRQAFKQHWNEHHCPEGISNCPEGLALFSLQPLGDQIIIA